MRWLDVLTLLLALPLCISGANSLGDWILGLGLGIVVDGVMWLASDL